jgi:ankyrin repeat protein
LGNAVFKCEISSCKSTFARKDNVKRHVQKYHPGHLTPDRQADDDVAGLGTKEDEDALQISKKIEQTPLTQPWWQMAAIGNVPALELLLRSGCDIDMEADDGNTALHCAAQNGQTTALKFILENGANVNAEDFKSQTPLLRAAISGKSDIILMLLRAGGTVVRFGQIGYGRPTPGFADYIVATGDPDLVQAILDMDMPQLRIDRQAKAAVLVAAAARIGQTPILESLASSDRAAFTPFRTRSPIFLAVANGHLEADRTMMALTGLSEDSKSLPSLVCTAARRGHLDILRLLLESFPSALNRQNYSKQSALHSAASKKRLSSVLYLLSFPDIDVNQEEGSRSKGPTALHLAALCGAIDVVRALIVHADIDLNRIAKDRYNTGTALQMAVERRHLDVVQALLLCPGIDTSSKSGEGTALFLAARSGSLEISRALLEHGARDDTAIFPTLRTGLHLTRLILQYDMQQLPSDAENIVQSRAQLAEFLFHAKGYQYHEVSKNGVHLVSLAAKENDADLLRVLLNLDSITPDGLNEKMNYERFPWYYRTPLNYAKSRGYTEIADLLASHGAIDKFFDPYGRMAAQERREALELAAKNDESTQPAQEQPPPSEASRETPEVASQEEYDSDSELEQEPYSYIDEYISPHSNEDESERESKRQRRE